MKLTADVPGGSSKFDLFSPSSWVSLVLGIVVLLLGVGIASKLALAASAKLPGNINPRFDNVFGVPVAASQFGGVPKIAWGARK